MREVVRIHSSSGTTGIPTVIYFTRDDVDNWTDLLARSIVGTGRHAGDVFQNMMTYGMFTGGLGLHYGAERVGMTVIPIGGGNTKRQIQTMKDFQTTVVHVTPSYLLHIHSKLGEDGICAQGPGPAQGLHRGRAALREHPPQDARNCCRSTPTTPTA